MRRPDPKPSSAAALFGGLALALGVLLVGAQLVVAAPGDPTFTVTPEVPRPGETVTFTATDVRGSDRVSWDFDGDGGIDAFGPTVSHVYVTAGQRTVLMRVTRASGEVVNVTRSVRVDAPPTASFTASPNPATVGQTVQFDARASSDPDGTIATYAWDLDNDGQFDDATGAMASRSFAAAGTHTVSLRVTDTRGSADVATAAVTVNPAPVPTPPVPTPPVPTPPAPTPAAPSPNRPPVASFTASPRLPLAGDIVQFVSTSSDPEGAIASHAWDLDDDGQFDDSFGRAPLTRYGAPGAYAVGLRVTDAQGAAAVVSRTIVVGARAPSVAPALDMMRPFPVVRIVGRSTRSGARIRLLVVRAAPRGARVTVRCRGRGCRIRSRSKYVRSSSVRFRSFERRMPTGVRIQVFVTRRGTIGKYTSFKIRRARRPLRRDLCVTSVRAKPQRCPMS